MTKKRVTKKEMFNAIAKIPAVASNPQFAEFIAHEIELLEKKSGTKGERKPTANQQANAGFKEVMLSNMEKDRLYTISELIKEMPGMSELSNQRVSAIVRQMVESGTVKRTEDKRKAFFSIV